MNESTLSRSEIERITFEVIQRHNDRLTLEAIYKELEIKRIE